LGRSGFKPFATPVYVLSFSQVIKTVLDIAVLCLSACLSAGFLKTVVTGFSQNFEKEVRLVTTNSRLESGDDAPQIVTVHLILFLAFVRDATLVSFCRAYQVVSNYENNYASKTILKAEDDVDVRVL